MGKVAMKKNSKHLKIVLENYRSRKKDINSRLGEFKKVGEKGDKKIFSELCFCILTPQSKARTCDKAIQEMIKNDILFKGTTDQIQSSLRGVRFPNNKARYIIRARDFFTKNDRFTIKDEIGRFKDNRETREWLISNIKGISYKEASHFLRNIGKGEDLAILDRHILKNLRLLKIIDEENAVGKTAYLEIESKMLQFSKKIEISPAELDLLLWSMETGEIFK